jgi:hypothetical protein
MTRLVRSTTINAPLDAVEAIVIDGENSPEWVAGCLEAETGEGYPEPGSKLHRVQKMGPVKIRQTMIIAGRGVWRVGGSPARRVTLPQPPLLTTWSQRHWRD